jgi:hypothetical protein
MLSLENLILRFKFQRTAPPWLHVVAPESSDMWVTEKDSDELSEIKRRADATDQQLKEMQASNDKKLTQLNDLLRGIASSIADRQATRAQ